ncbi:MAG: nucleoside hydrolase [Actinomycetota bacterium]|nr:nucleoside hydrolase [Actinomycetota bacterium]
MGGRRVLIDCDPGHDDAIAILLASVHAEIVGITTVSGNASLVDTTRNALVVTQILGLDVEVHAGAARPLLAPARSAPQVHGETGLDGPVLPPLERSAASHDALGFLLDATRSEEGLWLVATGPLTNVALALRADPHFAERLAGITLMGGSAAAGNVTPVAEFNAWCDPEAAAIVFAAPCPVWMSGLDLTHQVLVRPSVVERIRRLGSPVAAFVADLFDFYLDGYAATHFDERAAPLHDPCALLALTHPTLFGRTVLPIAVETSGRLTRGMTVVDRRRRTGGHHPTDGTVPTTSWVHTADADAVLDLLVDAVAAFA